MKTTTRALLACVVVWSGTGQAQQIYKWTDANGKVHYGDKKDAEGAKQQQELNIKLPPAPPPEPKAAPLPPEFRASAPRWPQPPQPVAPQFPQSVSGGREHGTDGSRCALARDVLNGSLRHPNGAPIDQYDRDVAQGDIKRFCR